MSKEFLAKHIRDISPVIEECLNLGKQVRLTVIGTSMFPLLGHLRDSAILEKQTSYEKYDVIFYRRKDGACVLHRIIGVKNGAFVLCGDYQTEPEYPIYPEQVLGKMVQFLRKGKQCSADSFGLRCYSVLWCAVRPLRPKLLRLAIKLRGWLKK